MKASLVDIDSRVWGKNVLSLSDVSDDDDLVAGEAEYRQEHCPAYVSVRLPLGNLTAIHRFERLGFSFVECQLQLLARFKTEYDVSSLGYDYSRVTTIDVLKQVLEIVGASVVHDRFSIDPGVPEGFSGRRYEAYVRQSFERQDEEVWGLFDPHQGKVVAFRTFRHTGPCEAMLLLGGVRSEMKALGLGVISSHYCFNQIRQSGIKRAITHISAGNGPIMDLEVGHFGFRYQKAFAVLRKLYY